MVSPRPYYRSFTAPSHLSLFLNFARSLLTDSRPETLTVIGANLNGPSWDSSSFSGCTAAVLTAVGSSKC